MRVVIESRKKEMDFFEDGDDEHLDFEQAFMKGYEEA